MKKFEIFFGLLRIPFDFIMVILGFLAAYQLRLVTEPIQGIANPIDYTLLPTINEYIEFSLGTAAALVVIFALGKMYNLKMTQNFTKEFKKIFIHCFIWAMAIITYFFFIRAFPFSRLAILYSFALTGMFVVIGRGLIRVIQYGFLKMDIGRRRLVFIGNNNVTNEIYQELAKDKRYKIVGLIAEKDTKSKIKHLGNINQLKYIFKKNQIDEIIQTKSDISDTQSEDILQLCDFHHINYRFIPDLLDVRRTNIEIETIASIPIINIKPTPLDGWGKVVKRIIDIIGALTAFVLFSPIFLITAVAIKLDSRGPILFTKLDDGKPVKRIGQQGKPFRFYKFRSMKPGTHNQRYSALSQKNHRKDSPLVKIKDDPRITRVGKFIRRYSIDELPQLWNVLIGNMSLVGPRPHLPEEVKKYKKHHHFVLTIKPGLTGLPQVSGRSDLDFEQEVKLDRYYIENWSIILDIRLILKTFKVIFRGYKE